MTIPTKSISGWTPFDITIRKADGNEVTWTRYAPDADTARRNAMMSAAREYPLCELVSVVPHGTANTEAT